MVKNPLQGITALKFIYLNLYKFNQSKPICEVNDVLVQWDECDLSDCPPARGPSTMTAHGKINIVNHDDLPKTFKDVNGNEHLIEDIHSYKSSR